MWHQHVHTFGKSIRSRKKHEFNVLSSAIFRLPPLASNTWQTCDIRNPQLKPTRNAFRRAGRQQIEYVGSQTATHKHTHTQTRTHDGGRGQASNSQVTEPNAQTLATQMSAHDERAQSLHTAPILCAYSICTYASVGIPAERLIVSSEFRLVIIIVVITGDG